MIELLDQQRIIADDFKQSSYQTTFVDLVFKLSFKTSVKLREILDFVNDPKNSIRFATNREVFDMLNKNFPIQQGETIVCLEKDLIVGDEVLAIDINGPSIVSVAPSWQTNYSFPVALC